jgi:hypothetical protein
VPSPPQGAAQSGPSIWCNFSIHPRAGYPAPTPPSASPSSATLGPRSVLPLPPLLCYHGAPTSVSPSHPATPKMGSTPRRLPSQPAAPTSLAAGEPIHWSLPLCIIGTRESPVSPMGGQPSESFGLGQIRPVVNNRVHSFPVNLLQVNFKSSKFKWNSF